MSDEIINNLTLNCLISQTQLLKLNKQRAEKHNKQHDAFFLQYKENIIQLFHLLVTEDYPADLVYDVKDSYNNFIEKSIYYLQRSSYFHKKRIENDDNDQEIFENVDIKKVDENELEYESDKESNYVSEDESDKESENEYDKESEK
jgi:hypothetical protein